MRTYFGGEFSEAAIRSNFVLVYELLDEVADHGWPQVREREGKRERSFFFFSSSLLWRPGRSSKKKKTHFLFFFPAPLSLPLSLCTPGHGRQLAQGPRLPKGLHHLRGPPQEGGRGGRGDAPGHRRRRLAPRRAQVQAQRGLPGRHGKGVGAGRGRGHGAEGRREFGSFFFRFFFWRNRRGNTCFGLGEKTHSAKKK